MGVSLIPNVGDDDSDAEAKVFYLKMAGDYYRYLAESVGGQETGRLAADYYEKASVSASKNLSETHPIRLGLALNQSVCYYEILKEPQTACDLAKKPSTTRSPNLTSLKKLITRIPHSSCSFCVTTSPCGRQARMVITPCLCTISQTKRINFLNLDIDLPRACLHTRLLGLQLATNHICLT